MEPRARVFGSASRILGFRAINHHNVRRDISLNQASFPTPVSENQKAPAPVPARLVVHLSFFVRCPPAPPASPTFPPLRRQRCFFCPEMLALHSRYFSNVDHPLFALLYRSPTAPSPRSARAQPAWSTRRPTSPPVPAWDKPHAVPLPAVGNRCVLPAILYLQFASSLQS